MVFTDELKFEINRLDSKSLFVKSVSITNLPNVNGVFIGSSFRKDNTLTLINQKVTYYMVSYKIVTYTIIFAMSFRISKLDVSPTPATKEKPSERQFGGLISLAHVESLLSLGQR